jgi:succinyl-diaminopimelate desuccinylase
MSGTQDQNVTSDRRNLVIDDAAVVKFTQELVRIPSVYEEGGSSEAPVTDAVVAQMHAWGWKPDVVAVAPGRSNVIVTIDGGGGPGPLLGFEGHLDVVTEGNLDEWTFDPFGAEIIKGRMYGRGTADMKAGVAAMMFAVRALQTSGPFPGAIRLFALCDEEGMMTGAKHAVASGALAGVAGVIVCEPEGDEVCPTSKGAIRLRLDFIGKMAHGAMPFEGRNPLPVLGMILEDLSVLETELQERHGAHEHMGTSHVTPTVVTAGRPEQMNTTSAVASLYVDIRTIPGVDHDEMIERIRRQCLVRASDRGIAVEVTVIDDRPPVQTPDEDPIVQCLVAAHEEVTGKRPALGGVPGTTDGTIFTRDAKVPTVVYGPGGKWIAHQADEFVEVASISRYARTYARAALTFLSR